MTKRAVVVGTDGYSGIDSSGKSNLRSCVVDADSMIDMLVSSVSFISRSDPTGFADAIQITL